MFGSDATSDKTLQKAVNKRLQRSGAGAQSGLIATVLHGNVTLTGKLRYASQRLSIVKALRGVSGVRQVNDQMQLPPAIKPHGSQFGSA
jgi:osmotically-inducible protein OsmY